jgi:hypothetical protein
MPPVAVRLRRDFPNLLALIRAHALLHRATRQVVDDRVIASFEDYAAVRTLVADLIGEAVERSVPESIRSTVEAVDQLTLGGDEATVVDVGGKLGIDKSAASRRVRAALDRGYLRNLEDRRGRPLRLTTGDPLPDEQTILPSATELEELHGCSASGGDGLALAARLDDVAGPEPARPAGQALAWLEAARASGQTEEAEWVG